MSDLSKYVLDANVFIEAHRRYYSFDIGPGFWDSLILNYDKSRLCCIDRIEAELMKGKDTDALKNWVIEEVPDGFFVPTDTPETFSAYSEIMNWVETETQYSRTAKAEFAELADAWIIAFAMSSGSIVVTQEVRDANIKKKVPIPNVCDHFGIKWIDTFEMMRCLKIRLG